VPVSCSLWHSEPAPNLLLIVVDSLRFDAISQSLGAARTPNLHALVDDGVSMTCCFSHTPVNDAALASLFSSRMPNRSGLYHDGQVIDPDLPLLAEELQSEGYLTFASVSRDLTLRASEGAPDPGLLRGFRRVQYPEYPQWPAYEVGTAAREFVHGCDPSQPWFAFVHFSDPHEPYEAYETADAKAMIAFDGDLIDTVPISNTSHWHHQFDVAPGKHRLSFKSDAQLHVRDFACHSEGEPLSTSFLQGGAGESVKTSVVSIENNTSETIRCLLSARIHDAPSLAQIRERYRLEVEHVDRAIGALVEELKTSNKYDNTLVVVTATHGQALGERGHVGAGEHLYDEVLRVPLVVKPVNGAPELATMRKQRHMLLRHIDVAPSILALLDTGHLPGSQGTSLLENADRMLIAETRPPEAPSKRVAIRDERYKLIYDAGDRRYEMFDLRVDMLELENVFMLQGHLRMAWQSRLRQLSHDPNDPEPAAPTELEAGVPTVSTGALQH
jgi:arylsulfatase A-like enzyme